MGKIINNEELTRAIVEIEVILNDFELVERYLLVEQLKARIDKVVDNLRDSDKLNFAIDKLPFGKLLKKATKAAEEGD